MNWLETFADFETTLPRVKFEMGYSKSMYNDNLNEYNSPIRERQQNVTTDKPEGMLKLYYENGKNVVGSIGSNVGGNVIGNSITHYLRSFKSVNFSQFFKYIPKLFIALKLLLLAVMYKLLRKFLK